MSRAIVGRCDTIIAGDGIAAAAVALRLLALGFHPLLLSLGRDPLPGAEAIPEAVLPLLAECYLEQAVKEADGISVRGFQNNWDEAAPRLLPGRWIHLDRSKLARAAIRQALSAGAAIKYCTALPKPSGSAQGIRLRLEGKEMEFVAAIDGTGRSAAWSRPTLRRGNQAADLYEVPKARFPRSKVARLREGWAYGICLAQSATIGIMTSKPGPRHILDSEVREQFGIGNRSARYIGRRPAFPQWSEYPLQARRMAVGDAAFASDPIGGLGIRFALSSAFAAAAVVNTWSKTPASFPAAELYYREFIHDYRLRHFDFLQNLASLRDASGINKEPTVGPLPERVYFSAPVRKTALNVNSLIRMEEAVVLPDGSAVRWVGGADLVRLREMALEPLACHQLVARLESLNLAPSKAMALLQWCWLHGVISGCPSP